MKQFKGHVVTLLHSYSEIFFVQNPWVGALFFFVTLTSPNVGASGFISIASAYLFARLIGMDKEFLKSGFFTYNALLVGLSIGYIFAISPLSIFFIMCAGVFTLILSVMVKQIFTQFLGVPILSVPFVLVSSICYLASYGYSQLYVTSLYTHSDIFDITFLPYWIKGFFVSLGSILFFPYATAGIIFSIAILCSSRIIFLLAVMGYYLGAVLSGIMDGAIAQSFSNVNNFNYILIAIALGGVFLVPAPMSFLIAGFAVAIATIFMDAVYIFWATFNIPVFTLPFNLITLSFIYVLSLVGFPLVAPEIRKTPEKTLDDYLCNSKRFKHSFRKLNLPFSGSWTVWQGFDGKWTHKDCWRYAYDFVITQDGQTYYGEGLTLPDYYAYRKPVLAPCKGRVVRVINTLPDNPPGKVDRRNNWGNLVIIDTESGYYVEISHFATESICVEPGDWVEVGTMLGECGNSGNSPQPHIHIQVQINDKVGAATLPYCFQSYRENNQYIHADLPDEEAIVHPLMNDSDLDFKTNLPLDQDLVFKVGSVHAQQQEAQQIVIKTGMTFFGEMYLALDKSKLYFKKDDHSFYFYRLEGSNEWLKLIFSAMPKLPLIYKKNMTWHDTIPISVIMSGWKQQAYHFIRAFHHKIGQVTYQASWRAKNYIKGAILIDEYQIPVDVHLSEQSCFSRLQVGSRYLEYVEQGETHENP